MRTYSHSTVIKKRYVYRPPAATESYFGGRRMVGHQYAPGARLPGEVQTRRFKQMLHKTAFLCF